MAPPPVPVEIKNPLHTSDTSPEHVKILEDAQKEIDNVEIALERNNQIALLPMYEKRREILKKIPHFWGSALAHHAIISELLGSEEDREALTYLEDVWVERDPLEYRALTIHFYFAENPFFSDKVLTKKFEFVPTPGLSTAIGENGLSESMIEFEWDKNIKPSTCKIQWKQPNLALTKKYPRVMEEGVDDIDQPGSFFHIFELLDDEEDFALTIAQEVFSDAIEYYFGRGENSWITDDEDDDEDEDDDDDSDDDEDFVPKKRK